MNVIYSAKSCYTQSEKDSRQTTVLSSYSLIKSTDRYIDTHRIDTSDMCIFYFNLMLLFLFASGFWTHRISDPKSYFS